MTKNGTAKNLQRFILLCNIWKPDSKLPIDEFFRPLPLLATIIMFCNDYAWRHWWPNWWTGKISDFAVVVMFPAFFTATMDLLLYTYNYLIGSKIAKVIDHSLSLGKIYTGLTITSMALIFLNTSATFQSIYLSLLESIDIYHARHQYHQDFSDIIALIFLPIAYLDLLQVLKQKPRSKQEWQSYWAPFNHSKP